MRIKKDGAMKRAILKKEYARRLLAFVLAFALMLGTLDAGALRVFADDLSDDPAETPEIIAETAETIEEDNLPEEEDPNASAADFEALEVIEEEETAEEPIEEDPAGEEADLEEEITEETVAEEVIEEESIAEEETAEEEITEETDSEESYIDAIESRYGGKVTVLRTKFSYDELSAAGLIDEALSLLKSLRKMAGNAAAQQRDWLFSFREAGNRRSAAEDTIELKGKLPEEVTAQMAEVEVELDTEADDILCAYDITLERDGEEYQPARSMEVTFTSDKIAEAADSGMQLSVVHIADDGEETVIDDVTIDGDTLTFRADSFSVYVVIAHEGGQLIEPRVEFHFLSPDYIEKTVDGRVVYSAAPYEFPNTADEEQTSQIVKNGETLEKIANPANRGTHFFFGWFIVDAESVSDSGRITYSWPADPEQIRFEKTVSIHTDEDDKGNITGVRSWRMDGVSHKVTDEADEDGCIHVYLAPLYDDYFFVNFHLGAKGTTIDSNLMTRKLIVLGSDSRAEVTIGNIQAPSSDAKHLVFAGWETLTEDENGDPVTDTYYNSETMIVTGETDLYPVFAEARWIYFNTGKSGNGATYVGAEYLLTSDEDETGSYFLTELPVSRRNGFRFDGWFTDEDVQITDADGKFVDSYVKYAEDGETVLYKIEEGKLFVYKQMEDVTLYADWHEIEDTTCSVIVWKQKITDAVDAAAEDKEYDYETSVTGIPCRSGKTLADLQAEGFLDAYTNLKYTGFHYASAAMSAETLAGDGTTVINVYYDRTMYTLTFQDQSGNKWQTVKTIEALYGQNISANFPIAGSNGTTYDQGERWEPQSSKTYSEVLVFIDIMPDENVTFHVNRSTAGTKTMYYYVEILPSETAVTSRNGVDYKLYNVISANYNFITEAEDFLELEGFSKNGSNPAFKSGQINNSNTANFYYTRNSYELAFEVNYPNLASVTYETAGEPSENKEVTLRYEESLSDYGPTGAKRFVPNAPDHYIFQGWYEDETGTVPFNFNSAMPAANKVVYGKWTPEVLRVQIDPNGAEIDHINHAPGAYSGYGISEFRADGSGYNRSRATYINAVYNESISEYKLERMFTPVNDADAASLGEDEVFYYLNTQYQSTDGSGLPSDLRNALYITEAEIDLYYDFYATGVQYNIDNLPASFIGLQKLGKEAWKSLYLSEQKYRRLNAGEKYEFLGWYQVYEDGSLAAMPYDFADPVTSPITLRAMWRLDGGFLLQYTPKYTMPDGTVINGNMPYWSDPKATGISYADQASTEVYRQPTGITANGIETADYIFLGWRLVSEKKTLDEEGNVLSVSYVPLEDDVYYDPGDDFTVQSKYADIDLVIHLQAVYEEKNASSRRPEVANLTLDANTGYLVDAEGTELEDDANLPWGGNGTIFMDAAADRIVFGDLQSNAAVHLYRYATKLEPAGVNYFAHPDGYFLLGFDEKADEGDFIASFPGDAVIAVQRTDDKTIYAVWEPMVYLNIINETGAGTVTFGLSAEDNTALYVVNEKNGVYDRVAVEDATNLSVAAGETLRLAVPYGAEKEITLSGTNRLGTGWMLTAESHIEGDFTDQGRAGDPAAVNAANGGKFTLKDRLVVDADGINVTFTAVKSKRTLVLDDNWSGGSSQEFYLDDASERFELPPSVTTRLGYVFQGWSRNKNAETPTYDATGDTPNLTIESLSSLFGSSEVVTLYAVWHANVERGTVYVYKSVPAPGDQDKDFTFTMAFSGKFVTGKNTLTISEQKKSFTLAHGEYLVVTSKQDIGKSSSLTSWSSSAASLDVTVQKYNADGSKQGSEQKMTWTASKKGAGSFTELNYSVTEANYTGDYYDTSIEIAGYIEDYELTAAARAVSWHATDAGGTAIFTNARRTADVTVKKVLKGTNAAGSFKFDAAYALDGRTVSLGTVSIASGTAGHTFRNIPTGAVLTVTEAADVNYLTSAVSAGGAEDQDSADNAFSFLVTKDDTVTFTNVLKSVKVRMISVDQDGNPGVEAFFRLASASATLGSQLYPNADSGLFWEGDLSIGTYTLTETWVQNGYLGLDGPVTLTLAEGGAVFTSDSEDAEVSGSETEGYTVTVYNQKTVNITVNKVLDDPLIASRQFEFTARVRYEDVDQTKTFAVTNGEPYVLNVPKGAEVTLTETPVDVYTTKVAVGSEDAAEGNAIVLGDAVHPLGSDAAVTFTNTRKTVSVTVRKVVRGGSSEAFPFTATLRNGADPVRSCTVNASLGLVTDESGRVNFGLAHDQSIVLTVPVGAVLQIEEDPGDEYTAEAAAANGTADADGSDNIFVIASCTADEVVTFTNTVVEQPAPTDVDLNTFPYWVLLAGGGALLILLIAGRRKKNEE